MELSKVPSVDRLLIESKELIASHGRGPVTEALREVLDDYRDSLKNGGAAMSLAQIIDSAAVHLASHSLGLKRVINLTGTVLHTNLGRAILPPSAIETMVEVAAGVCNLEFDLQTGARGKRDDHIAALVCRITGAEAATVVNNNAAAVMLVLNTFALGKQVPVSRGELVEIGGSFRIPEIMARSGCELVEVGATNRTHLKDYEVAISDQTGLLMKVHTSNYQIQGFTHAVTEAELSGLATRIQLPLVTDLGSGMLVDLRRYNLPYEPTVQAALEAGADLVTFSGDKLLGGPQSGIIAGRQDLIEQINANPLKRALRVDKLTLAALHSVLELYLDPDSLPQHLPTLHYLTRDIEEIAALAGQLSAILGSALPDHDVSVIPLESQIGSGALPLNTIPSVGIAFTPTVAKGSDQAITMLANRFRELPTPVIGRIHDGRFILDLRMLDSVEDIAGQLT